jgi:hypothetical protein
MATMRPYDALGWAVVEVILAFASAFKCTAVLLEIVHTHGWE